jgi:hypothetical protein
MGLKLQPTKQTLGSKSISMASMTLKIEDTSNSTVQKIELPKIREKNMVITSQAMRRKQAQESKGKKISKRF